MGTGDKYKKRGRSERIENVRDERQSIDNEEPKLVFNFKDFDATQKVGQSFENWQEDETLAVLLERFRQLSQKTLLEAQADETVKIYGKFPRNSDFVYPKYIAPDVQWAVIKKITGQKTRVVGYVIDNVFYVVFLDKNHKFWPTKKQRT